MEDSRKICNNAASSAASACDFQQTELFHQQAGLFDVVIQHLLEIVPGMTMATEEEEGHGAG